MLQGWKEKTLDVVIMIEHTRMQAIQSHFELAGRVVLLKFSLVAVLGIGVIILRGLLLVIIKPS
jgi:hypothetical protein